MLISAQNQWVLCYDNLSHLSEPISDAFCRLSTGGGFSKRALYTDNEEIILNARRPVILNGISEIITRPDLLSRSILMYLELLDQTKRKTESDFWNQFNQAHAEILGALLDAASSALQNLPMTQLQEKPRMADFAQWVVAAENGGALPWVKGEFMRAYSSNRQKNDAMAVEVSVIAPSLKKFAQDKKQWSGKMTELFNELSKGEIKEGFPKNPQALSRMVGRLAPNFRSLGIDIHVERTTQGSAVTIKYNDQSDSA